MTDPVSDLTQRLVVRLQSLYRARRARRQAVELANFVYVKYWDSVSGLAYYYNVRTGLSFWKKPLLLAARDAAVDATFDFKASLVNDEDLEKLSSDAMVELSLKERQERRGTSLEFKNKCKEEKQKLLLRHHRKIARAIYRFDKKIMDDMKAVRQERQVKLKKENYQLMQDLSEGKKKEHVQTIREAAMQGNLAQVEMLLSMGFSANAESAMGLTPLLAACQGNHVKVVRLLLSSGALVNHAHIKTGRTALMEAARCASPLVLKELLRFGAHIDVEDVKGETVFDCIKDTANRDIIEQALQPWTMKNAALFPTAFRQVSLTFALIRKRQWVIHEANRVATRRELIELKQMLQRKCIEAKVRYDQDMRGCNYEPTLMRRLTVVEKADSCYDAERRMLLLALQDAVNRRRDMERPCFLPVEAIQNLLSFCARHWFDENSKHPRNLNKKSMKSVHSVSRNHSVVSFCAPKKLRPPPFQFPEALEAEWEVLERSLEKHCNQLQAVTGNEYFDITNNISRDANGKSLATLDICVQQGEYLPYRDPRKKDMIDPCVRIFLRSASIFESKEVYQSELRIADRNPVWNYCCQMVSVPSIQDALDIQIVDATRGEVAGEVLIPLRSFVDQKDHNGWYIVPPTLRQQILEKKPRDQPARIQVCIRFTHTKSLVLTRALQQLLKTREGLVQKRRDVIQNALDNLLDQLP